jgi:TonB family protein
MKKTISTALAFLIVVITLGQSAKYDRNFEKGTRAIELKNYQKGILLLTLAIEEYPNIDAYFNRAAAYFQIGDTCSFCADLKKASDLNDIEAPKLYILNCASSVTIKKVPDSLKFGNSEIRNIQVIHSKCNSDSIVTYIYEKTQGEISSSETNKTDTSPVYTIVEEMPSFVGGEKERMRFIANNLIYPLTALKNKISGTVYISYIIDANGFVTDVKVLKGIGGGCDEEAARVVKMMPKWNPGKQNGKPVRVLFNMPVNFILM